MINILIGTELSNQELHDMFGCSTQGGMRRSLKTNTLVLISDKLKSIYQDRTDGKVLHYTGMGLEGDQDINNAQNKTLNESRNNGVEVHLFEVLAPQIYTYAGQVELSGQPYQEKQEDKNGNIRNVWMFPLSLKGSTSFKPVPIEKLHEVEKYREKQISKLSDDELKKRANLAPKKSSSREINSKQYIRNDYVAEQAKRRANGICELCKQPAPFLNKNKQPYLEVHHIIWLSKGGEDSIENTVALCPNCHRRMHILDLDEDKKVLSEINLDLI